MGTDQISLLIGQMLNARNLQDVSHENELVRRHKDGKMFLLKKMQIKINPDNATDNSLKYKASII